MNSANTAYAAGYMVGMYSSVVICWLLTILSAIGLRKRRGTNRKCVLSLTLFLGAFSLATTFGVAMQTGVPSLPVRAFSGLAMMLLIVGSLLFGIMGLVEFHRRRRRFDRGRKRAILAMVLNLLMLVGVARGFYAGFTGRAQMAGKVSTGAPDEAITISEWNFRIVPPAGWVRTKLQALNPVTRLTLADPVHGQNFMVIAEQLPAGDVDLKAAADILKGNIAARGGVSGHDEQRTEYGFDAIEFETELKTEAGPLFYVHWVTQHRGTLYQLITFGPNIAREGVREASRSLVRGFSLVDREAVAMPSSAKADTIYSSERYGFRVDLSNTRWTRRWPTLATEMPPADFGVMDVTGKGAFCVIPVLLDGEEPELEVLTNALAGRLTIPFPDDAIYALKDWRQPRSPTQAKGHAFAYERQLDGVDYVYRLRVLSSGTVGYLLVAWHPKGDDFLTDLLDEALDTVTFSSGPGTPAARLADLSLREAQQHAFIYNSIGIWYDEANRSEEALGWLKRAYAVGKPDVQIATNYVNVCVRAGKLADGLAFLDEHRSDFPGNHKLTLLRGDALMASGDVDGALKACGEAFDAGYRDDSRFAGYIELLCRQDRTEDAETALQKYYPGAPTAVSGKLRARVQQSKGEFAKAAEGLREIQKAYANDSSITLMLAETLFQAGQHVDALAECDKLVASKRDSGYVYRLKGLAEAGLKRYREAKASFEKGLEKEPADSSMKELLDHVSGLLGEGTNTLVKTPIEPVAIPAALRGDVRPPKNSKYLEGFHACYDRCITAVAYEKGRELKTTLHEVIRVLDRQGVEAFSTLEFSFDPLSEEIFVNGLTVRNEKGEVVGSAKVENSYVTDTGEDETATQRKVLRVPVPGLLSGCTIDVTVTRRETAGLESFPFRAHGLVRALPVLKNTLFVQAPEESLKWEATSGLRPKKVGSGLAWSLDQPPVYRWEPLQAPLETFVPMVWLGDAKASWQEEAKTYLGQINDRLEIVDAVRAAAADEIKEAKTDADKVARLARFVQRELTYKAIEFGRRARMPDPAPQILRNRYGDCKDHSLLLKQLLESAGVPANLVLVRFGGALRSGIPSLDQFNHMIVHVPNGKSGTFIDCTSKTGDLMVMPPIGLAGQEALILDPAKPRLVSIPDYSEGAGDVAVSREISIEGESDLSVRETVSFAGTTAVSMRLSLQSVQPTHRNRHLLQMMNNAIPSLDLRNATIENLDDPAAPLRLQLDYRIPKRCQIVGQQLVGQLPAIWERMFLAGAPVEKRLTPFKIRIPTKVSSTVQLACPPGWQLPESKSADLARPFCIATLKTQVDSRELKLEGNVTQKTGQFPASEYRAYTEAMDNAMALLERGIVLQKKKK